MHESRPERQQIKLFGTAWCRFVIFCCFCLISCVGVCSGIMNGCVRYVLRVSASSLSGFLRLLLLLMLVVLIPSVRTQNFLFHFPFDEICRRLIFFTLSGVLFPREKIIPQLNETVKHDNIRESDRHHRRYMYIPSFAFPI